jgi:hypothetical protein
MSMKQPRTLLAPPLSPILAAAALFLAGCGESSNKVSIAGHVTYQGQPLANGSIAFYPAAGRPVIAGLSVDGAYSTELDPGDYTVTVDTASQLPPGFHEGDPVPPPKLVLPPEYTTRAKSKLTASVKEGQTEPINFALD